MTPHTARRAGPETGPARGRGHLWHRLTMAQELPGSLKLITLWLLLGTVIFVGYQWWERDAQQTRFALDGSTLRLGRAPDGHYHWPGRLNGKPVDFLVDTGATSSALSLEMARELGLPELGAVRSQTAGGPVNGQLVQADLVLEGGLRVDRLRLVALPRLGDRPLLGMDVLGRLRWQQVDGVLQIELAKAR